MPCVSTVAWSWWSRTCACQRPSPTRWRRCPMSGPYFQLLLLGPLQRARHLLAAASRRKAQLQEPLHTAGCPLSTLEDAPCWLVVDLHPVSYTLLWFAD